MAPILPSALSEPSSRALLFRLWREHLRRYRGLLTLTLLLTVVTAALTGLYPMVIKHAFDMFGDKDRRILYQLPALVVVLTVAKSAAQYGQTVMIQQIVLLVIRDLQRRMFTHLSRADLARIEREAPAALAARFTTDAAIIREALTKTVNGIADGLTVIGLVGSMLFMDPLLTVIAGLLYPLAAAPIQRIGKRIRRASGGMQTQMGETATFLNESFAQARIVRAYRLEGLENRRADIAFARLYRSLLSMTMSRARVDPLMEILGGVAVALVIGFSGWRAAMGHGSIGELPGFISALLLASRPLRALGSLNATMQEGMAGTDRVFQVIDEPAFVVDAPHATPLPPGGGLLRFDDVFYDYPDGRPGLQGLSFSAKPGITVALVGPSGAGKSTALSLIPRLHDVSSGVISLDGTDIRDLQISGLRDAMAYVGQDPWLFDDTVAANILRGKRGSGQELVDAAALDAAALNFINALPLGMQTPVGPGGQRLSGGQRQRVALARALLRDPRILLLDEATSALDAESEAAVQTALARLRKGRTTIVVAHRLSTVRDADLVVVMDHGKNVEQGTHASLLAADGLYARLVKTQAFAL